MKSLFITKGKNDMVVAGQYGESIYAIPVYRFDNKLCKALAHVCMKLHLPFLPLFLGEWANNVKNFDIIICEGLKHKTWLFEYLLKQKSNNCRLIMWHWNKIYKHEIDPNSELALECEQWSFDPDDCKQYNMRLNTQYYILADTVKAPIPKWDLYFIGNNKGRLEKLIKIDRYCKENGLKTYFHVVADENEVENRVCEELVFNKTISYEKNIENVINSKAILDVPIEGQHGLTLRVMEALYYRKKLVTFNPYVEKLSFYNKNNILICDDLSKIQLIYDFMQRPYIDTKECEEARQYYSFVEWMNRFI